jgi:arsenate reductase
MKALKQHGKRRVFNTSGIKYRELGLSEKIEAMSDKEAVDILASDGTLIKRPFLVTDQEETVLGFKKDEWKRF